MPIVSRINAEHYQWGEKCSGWHLLKSASLSVIEEMMPPGCSEVRHYHTRSQQFFYVLEGRLCMEIDGLENQIHAGQGVHIEEGVPHKAQNTSGSEVRFLVISDPPSHGDRVLA